VRIAFAAALALLSVLCLAAPAGAAMAVRILVTPVRPVAGQAATVSVQTLAPFTQKCIDDPTADYRPWSEWQTSDGGTLRLAAQATTREGTAPLEVAFVRRESDPTWWDGAIVFPTAGEWTLRMSYPTWSQAGAAAEACAGARITVVVDERLPSTTTDGPPDVAPAAYASAVAAALLMMLARRRHLQQRR